MNELDPEQLKKLEEVLRGRAYWPGTSREAWLSLMGAVEEVKRVRKEIEYSSAGGDFVPSLSEKNLLQRYPKPVLD